MSFNFLNDLFGKFRKKKKTKYADIEQRAASLLNDYNSNRISTDEFAEAMRAIDTDFNELMLDKENNTYIFDEDTPGWLNLFLGYKFRPWYKLHQMFNAARQNPSLTSDPRWPEIQKRELSENNALMRAVRYCLNEKSEKQA